MNTKRQSNRPEEAENLKRYQDFWQTVHVLSTLGMIFLAALVLAILSVWAKGAK